MNPELQQMVNVITAYGEGKEIQCRRRDATGMWGPAMPDWDFKRFEYRVKPEPPIVRNRHGFNQAAQIT